MVEREQRKAAASSLRGELGGLAGWQRHGVRRLLRSMVLTLGVLVSQKIRPVLSWGWGWYWGGGKHCSKT